MGVDIAEASIAAARSLVGTAPVHFQVGTEAVLPPASFDLSFSYEVIYLLPDLASHAAAMHAALRPGGVYYAVTGCHTQNPLWPAWRSLIGGTTNAPVQDRSPDDYAMAFEEAGFDVSVRRFGYAGFVPASKSRQYYPRLTDALDYPSEYKLLFRLAARR
jgi:SAM-dependent methyltransferase